METVLLKEVVSQFGPSTIVLVLIVVVAVVGKLKHEYAVGLLQQILQQVGNIAVTVTNHGQEIPVLKTRVDSLEQIAERQSEIIRDLAMTLARIDGKRGA